MDEQTVDTVQIMEILKRHRAKIRLSLGMCAHCSLCAESCFMFNSHRQDPRYMPAYKFIRSIGKIFKKRGKISRADLEGIRTIVWGHCVLCTRCYCPFGIDIPGMIALARGICRSQGVYPSYDEPEQETTVRG